MKQQSEIVIGIDLGNTYSKVGVIRNDKFQLINNEFGNKFTPSYVSFTDHERLVGDEAFNQQSKNAKNTVFNILRLIGRRFSDKFVQQEIQNLPFKVEAGQHDRLSIIVQSQQKVLKLYPEEVCSMILNKMKRIAEMYLGIKVNQAVVTTSCNLNYFSKRAIEDAGLICGLKILRIIIGSSAASFTYGMNLNNQNLSNILIFNLGGGSVTVSQGNIESQIIEIKATSGDNNLGGEDFDNILVNYCIKQFLEQYGIDLRQNPRAIRRLKIQCQKSKETLSTTNQTTIEVDSISQGQDLNIQLTRQQFEKLCLNLFHQCIYHVEQVLNESNLTRASIDQVILIGGASRIPKIQQLLKEYFNGKQLYHALDKDEAALFGASFLGALLKKSSQKCVNWLLLDTIPYSLGVGMNNQKRVIIKKDTNLPCNKSQTLSINDQKQNQLTIIVFEGQQSKQGENLNKLGYIQIDKNNQDRLNDVIINLTIDQYYQLNISAQDAVSKKNINIQVYFEQLILQDEEIQRLIEESEAHQGQVEEIRKKNDAKNRLESLIYDYKRIVVEELNRQEKWLESHQDEDLNIYNKKIQEIEQKLVNIQFMNQNTSNIEKQSYK